MQRWIVSVSLISALTSCGSPSAPPTALQPHAQAAAVEQPSLLNHILFFDENGDRQISLGESRRGLERLGIGTLQSTALSLVLNPVLSKQASGNLGTTVSIDGLVKHFKPTTTGIFGPGGRFVPERFESVFAKSDRNRDGSWDADEIHAMLKHDLIDPSLQQRTKVGFDLLLRVAGDQQVTSNGRKLPALSKQRLVAFYDGSLFYDLAAANRP